MDTSKLRNYAKLMMHKINHGFIFNIIWSLAKNTRPEAFTFLPSCFQVVMLQWENQYVDFVVE